MGIISFLILGLIAGAIAKAVMPGEKKWGVFSTLLLGILGVTFGSWLGNTLFNLEFTSALSVQTWAFAILGSVAISITWGLITNRR